MRGAVINKSNKHKKKPVRFIDEFCVSKIPVGMLMKYVPQLLSNAFEITLRPLLSSKSCNYAIIRRTQQDYLEIFCRL